MNRYIETQMKERVRKIKIDIQEMTEKILDRHSER